MEKRNEYKILVGKLEGKTPLGEPRLDGWVILEWIVEDRLRICVLDSCGSV
jgi:hypothetical protein